MLEESRLQFGVTKLLDTTVLLSLEVPECTENGTTETGFPQQLTASPQIHFLETGHKAPNNEGSCSGFTSHFLFSESCTVSEKALIETRRSAAEHCGADEATGTLE